LTWIELRKAEHKSTEGVVFLPTFAEDELVLEYHLVRVRTTLDGFGIADTTAFAGKLHKVG
jgi:hypothetical protein